MRSLQAGDGGIDVADRFGLTTGAAQMADADRAILRIGIDQQHAQTQRRRDHRCLIGRCGRQVRGKPERRALAERTFDPEFATHEPREASRNAEAETGAAITPGGAAVGLCERFENALLIAGGDADAGVADRHPQHVGG